MGKKFQGLSRQCGHPELDSLLSTVICETDLQILWTKYGIDDSESFTLSVPVNVCVAVHHVLC